MMTGILMSFVLFMGLAVDHAPSTASLDDVYQYAPDGANYAVFIDTKSILAPTLKKVTSMSNDPMVRELLGEKRAGELSGGIVSARAMAKEMVGLDPVDDIHWVAAWIKFGRDGEPKLLVAAKGNWPAGLLARMSKRMGGTLDRVHGRSILRGPSGKMAIGQAGKDVMLFGNAAWIEPRLARGWRAPKVDGTVRTLFAKKPNVVFFSEPSPASGNVIKRWFKGKAAFMRWPLLAHKQFGAAIDHKGFQTYWKATNTKGLQRAKLTFEGGVSLLRAMQHSMSGVGRLVLAWLPSKSNNSVIATLAKHRGTLLKMLDKAAGNGDFKATVKVNKRQKTVRVEAVGTSLVQMLPMVGLPMGVAYMGFVGSAPEKKRKNVLPSPRN